MASTRDRLRECREPRERTTSDGERAEVRLPEKILVALDCGETAGEAWQAASFLAETFGAEVQALHVLDDVSKTRFLDRLPEGCGVIGGDEFHEELRVACAPGKGEIPSEVLIRRGEAATVILSLALELGCDLVVLGAGKRSKLSRLLLGSTAEQVVREARVPVWLVPPGVFVEEVRSVVCAVDASPPAHAAMALTIQLCRAFVSRLELLTVTPPDEQGLDLKSRLKEFDLHGLDDVRTRGPAGEVVETIVEVALEDGCDLLVIGSAQRRGIPRLLDGNTAEKVLRLLSCSLLIVPASGACLERGPAPGIH
jgi:nucleotide-binding universal stress UspA family protein